MQKKMIALAVAGLVSGAAFAQTNVTVFGIMDVGYQYSWDNYASKTKDQSAIKAGGHDGSRIGFRGTEDLGNGLKVNFEMVAGFDADTGQSYGGRLMSEGAWLGLSGDKWGAVKGGYFATFLDDNTGVDVSGRHGIANTGTLYDTGKWNNFVAYYSPVWSGFQVKAGFSSNINAQDNTPNQYSVTNPDPTLNIRAYSAAASYANGGLKLGAAYAYYQPQDVSGLPYSTSNGYEWNAGISYDFKVVAVSLFGAKNSNSNPGGTPNFAGTNVDRRDFIALGLAVPIGAKDVVKLGYGQARTYADVGTWANGKTKDDSSAWGIVYFHNLSKRTNLYAMYGNVDSDNELYSINNAAGYQQAVNVGIRHLF